MDKLSKFSLTLLVLSFAFLFSFGMVAAVTGVSTNTTLNDSNVSGTYLIYASITECASDCYIGNVTFKWTYYNGTQVNLSTNNNNTANDSTFSFSWDTTTYDDANNGTLNLSAYNYVGEVLNATNSTINIDIDNGFPTATLNTATFATGSKIQKATTFSLGINADNSIGVNSCLAYFTDTQNSTVTSTSLTVTDNACSSTTISADTITLPRGRVYNVVVQVTDGNGNRTNSSDRSLSIAGLTGTPVTVDINLGLPYGDAEGDTSLKSKFSRSIDSVSQSIKNLFAKLKNIFTFLKK